MKILIAIIDVAALILVSMALYFKFSIRNMAQWESELIAEQKAARNDPGFSEISKEKAPIYYDDHDVSGLLEED